MIFMIMLIMLIDVLSKPHGKQRTASVKTERTALRVGSWFAHGQEAVSLC